MLYIIINIVQAAISGIKKDPVIRISVSGAQTRNRTRDTGIFSPLLYLLSYLSIWWAILGSNQGPTGYEPVALTTELMARVFKNGRGGRI